MTAAEIAEIAGIDARSVRRRFNNALPALLARELYVREAPSPCGGGLHGQRKEFAIARIARDFPGAVSDAVLQRAAQKAAA